jgi:hypothetical protein
MANMRAYMWFRAKDWLLTGAIEADEKMASDWRDRDTALTAAKNTQSDRKATRLPDAVSWYVHQPSPAVGKGRKGSKGKKPLVSFPGAAV